MDCMGNRIHTIYCFQYNNLELEGNACNGYGNNNKRNMWEIHMGNNELK
jgi:hypothetical protein